VDKSNTEIHMLGNKLELLDKIKSMKNWTKN